MLCNQMGSRSGAESQDAVSGFVKPDNDSRALDEKWAADEVRDFGHKFDGRCARGRLLCHIALAVKFVARIKKISVVTRADEFPEFGFGKRPFVQVTGIELELEF